MSHDSWFLHLDFSSKKLLFFSFFSFCFCAESSSIKGKKYILAEKRSSSRRALQIVIKELCNRFSTKVLQHSELKNKLNVEL